MPRWVMCAPRWVTDGWHRLSVTAIVLAVVVAGVARGAQPPPAPYSTGGPVPIHSSPTIVPNDAIFDVILDSSVKPYRSKAWGIKIGPHEIAFDLSFGSAVAAILMHFNRQGVIDGASSNYSGLRLYGKPLAMGFRRLAVRLRRHGWREGTCTRRRGHFAALGAGDQAHTFIVWSGRHVTVAMSTAHSAFARTEADCESLGQASAVSVRGLERRVTRPAADMSADVPRGSPGRPG